MLKKGFSDGFIVKYDSNGNVLWSKDVGYPNSSVSGNDIYINTTGKIYLTGYFNNRIVHGNDTINSIMNSSDIYVLNYNSFGVPNGAISAGGNSLDWAYSIDGLASDVYVTGEFISPNLQFGTNTLTCVGSQDVFLAKIGSITTNFEEQKLDALMIFPTPTNGVLNITNNQSKYLSIEIFNLLGQVIYTKDIQLGNNQINLSDFADGVYNILIKNKITTFEIVKKILIVKL